MKTDRSISRTIVGLLIVMLSGCGKFVESFDDSGFTFSTTFGEEPSSKIESLKGEGEAFRDSGHCYLRFKCDRSEFDRLVGTNFSSISIAEFSRKTSNAGITGPTPSWWTPTSNTSADFMESESFHRGFSRGQAFASFDKKTSIAWIYWDGSD